ncbi:MAG TPA: carbohydrate binding domain-containing protein [Candidatus Krumholzibacteria bacterium]|nr:carbohydrate binding domain-containing protein [Candidatus Krumholzibacteria bacterium]
MNALRLVPLMILLFAGGALAADEPAANLLPGGDFEKHSPLERSPGDWYPTVVPRTEAYVDFSWDDKVAHGGKRSVSIAVDKDHPEDVIAYNWTSTVAGCEAGRRYELSGWVRAENLASPAWIVVQCWNDKRDTMLGFATTQKDYPVAGTTDWTEVGTTFVVPEGTAEVRVRAGAMAPANRGGRAWFDDLAIRALD